MDNRKTASVSWVPFLGIAFIALKLAGCIDWAWWVVLTPFWAPPAVAAVCLLAIGAIERFKLDK